ncbi:NADPH-dependent 2,4-dienoyl-CoA reductase/sulfur reductase-like enzyme [Roseovarius sp. MBR-78]
MSRVFPAHAYGPGPRAACFWAATVAAGDDPVAQGAITCDVAVIGAGFTGLSAALHLAEAGQDVCVFEAESPGWGRRGVMAGFAVWVARRPRMRCCGGLMARRRVATGMPRKKRRSRPFAI